MDSVHPKSLHNFLGLLEVDFCGGRKTRVPGGKTIETQERTNKL